MIEQLANQAFVAVKSNVITDETDIILPRLYLAGLIE